mmetsp:Transcript_21865/g.75641  ORF Transcript_21865/g.75641 Transcript_21865/m.75641 type:complete len:191 (-) Transcript_21865:894-1466(-)
MRHLVRIAALCCALMAPAAGAADYCAALQGAADLDMHKWRVMSVPPMAAARAQRLHGRYAFQASLGDVVYKLGFAMVEGFPWPQPLDKEAYQRLRSIALRPGDVIVASYPKHRHRRPSSGYASEPLTDPGRLSLGPGRHGWSRSCCFFSTGRAWRIGWIQSRGTSTTLKRASAKSGSSRIWPSGTRSARP